MSFWQYAHLVLKRTASPAWMVSFGAGGPVVAALLHVGIQRYEWLADYERLLNGQAVIGAWFLSGLVFLTRSAWHLHNEQVDLAEVLRDQLRDKRNYDHLAAELNKEYEDGVHRLANQVPMDFSAQEAWLAGKLAWEARLRERVKELDCPSGDVSYVWTFPIENLQRRANNPMLLHKEMLNERLSRLKTVIDSYRARADRVTLGT